MTASNPYFQQLGFISAGFLNLSPNDAHEICNQNGVLLDVRIPYLAAYKQFGVNQILYIPLSELESNLEQIPTDQPVIVADSTGLRSREAMEILLKKGYKNIANMAGGLVEWEQSGLPVSVNNIQRLSGSCMCQLKPREK